MRVNVYAEEMTDRVEIVSKDIEGQTFTGVRLYLALPASFVPTLSETGDLKREYRPANVDDTVQAKHFQAPFIHQPGDDDSAAVTFWGKRDLRAVLIKMIDALDDHYGDPTPSVSVSKGEPPAVSATPSFEGQQPADQGQTHEDALAKQAAAIPQPEEQ